MVRRHVVVGSVVVVVIAVAVAVAIVVVEHLANGGGMAVQWLNL
jgi:hypothetical protein